jgi:oligosaccharyltransferase complex subunit epsilon
MSIPELKLKLPGISSAFRVTPAPAPKTSARLPQSVHASWLQAPGAISPFHQPNTPHLTMAPKRSQARESTPSATAKSQSATASGTPTPSRTTAAAEAVPSKSSVKLSANQSPQDIALGIWKKYLDTTPQRTKLIDVFMAFLVVVGVLQFVYCVLVGNYVRRHHHSYYYRSMLIVPLQPFNAFLSGFSATVGQFVLTSMC